MRFLIVVDMQVDFITGSLGNKVALRVAVAQTAKATTTTMLARLFSLRVTSRCFAI